MNIRLLDIIEYIVDNRGKNPPYYTDNGVPVIDTFLIGEQKYPNFLNVARYIDNNLYENFIRCKTKSDDLLITLVGNGYGNVCLCNDNSIIIQNAIGIRFNKSISQIYMFYYFKQREIKKWIQNLDRGSAQPNVKVGDVMRMNLNIPSLAVQNKIADILSHYDDLIEKNNRKIAILEEQIQELYKEWFVRFRFPGHEKIEHQSGIPNNWEYKGLNNLCIFKRGSNLTASEMIEGNIEVISAGKEPSGYHCKSNVKGPSITISSSGANAGYMSIHYDNIWAADCIFTNDNVNIFFLYEMLRYYQDAIYNQQRGSAQPHVYANNINELKLLMPKENLIVRFNAIAEKIHKAINKLKQSSNKLKLMRDLLLPRLMSGKLEVKG